MFLITRDFFKNISEIKLKKKILEKCSDFSKLMIEKEKQIRSLPKGYWVRKINNTEIYKFRLKSGDRILFTYVNDDRYNEPSILFLDYCTHDKQILRGKAISVESSILKAKDLQIDKKFDNDDLDNDNNFIKDYEAKGYVDLESIMSIVVDDSYIALLMNNNNEDYLYYLTEAQFECIKDYGKPVIITGAAGSGKTTVALHKLLSQSNDNSRIGYITYTELLSDNAKRSYEKFKTCNKGSVEFYYIHQFYSKILGVSTDNIATYTIFKDITDDLKSRNYKLLRKIDSLDIYTEYRGIIKGYIGLEANQIDKLSSRKHNMITIDEYIDLPNSYSIFSEEEKIEIYKLCVKYNEKLDELGKKDENDLAIETISKINEGKITLFDYIIVDEVQDLSEIQIYMLSRLTKNPNQIMFSGDIHQIINPTFFDFGRLKNIYYGLGIDTSIHTLSKNYRNTIEIIQLLNKLIKDRQQYIGKSTYDYNESGVLNGDKPLVGKLDESETKQLLELVSDKHYCAIIVSNLEEKERLISLCEGARNRIFLVNEIKGLEYDNIYCLNITSSNSSEWNKIYSGEAKGSSKYRYYFNLFYVAISRAKKNLFIYEDNINTSIINSIKQITNYQELFSVSKLELDTESTENDWIKEYKRLEKVGNIEKAIFARDKAQEQKIILENKRLDASRIIIYPGELDNEDITNGKDEVSKLLNEGFKQYQNRNYGGAIEIYEKALDLDKNNYMIYYYIASCFGYMSGGMNKSLEYYDWCLSLKEDFLEAYLDKAAIEKNIPGYTLNAIDTLKEALKYHSNIANVYSQLADLYMDIYKSDFRNEKDNEQALMNASKYYTLGLNSDKALKWDSLNKKWIKDKNNKYLNFLFKDFKENIKLCNSKEKLKEKINQDDSFDLSNLFRSLINMTDNI